MTTAPASAARTRSGLGGTALVVAATFFWGISAVLARHVMNQGVRPLVVVEMRLLLASLLLGTLLALFHRSALRVPRASFGRLLILGLFGIAAVQGSYYTTVAWIGVGLAILLQYLAPALVVGYEALTGRSPWTLGKVGALALATSGTALLVLAAPGGVGTLDPKGVALGLASAVFFAFYMIYGKETVERVPQWSVNFYTFAIAAVFWSFFEPLPRILASGYTASQWAMLLAIAVFSVLVPFALFYRGLELMPAWRAALTAMLEPVIAAVAAATFLGESLAPPQWMGAGLLLAGVAWVQWQDRPSTGSGTAVPPPD